LNEAVAISLARETLWVALQVGAPILGATLVIGVVVSIIQAVTQVNEMTLTFVPKVIGVFVAMLLFGPWMLQTLVSFTTVLFTNLGAYGS
jgi:flagellar biosynthetic protein FliQ